MSNKDDFVYFKNAIIKKDLILWVIPKEQSSIAKTSFGEEIVTGNTFDEAKVLLKL